MQLRSDLTFKLALDFKAARLGWKWRRNPLPIGETNDVATRIIKKDVNDNIESKYWMLSAGDRPQKEMTAIIICLNDLYV